MSDAPERIWIDAWGGNWSPVSGGTQEIEYIRADRIEALTNERDRLSSTVDTLERFRPHWAQGYSSDSVAAQASTAALVGLWEILGASDQTSAINALKALTKERDEAMQLLQTLSNMNGDLSRDMSKTKLLLLLAKAVEAFEKLARLGNGDRYGNSDGNMIARTALAEIEGDKT